MAPNTPIRIVGPLLVVLAPLTVVYAHRASLMDWWGSKGADLMHAIVRGASSGRPEDAIPPEAQPYAIKYGPNRNSQYVEEWLIRDFFQDRRGGVFVDVGANHFRAYSNTYFLDVELDWSGIAVEPLMQFAADYATYRPRTRFRSFFVSDVSDAQARLWLLSNNPLVASADKSFTTRYGSRAQAVTVPTIRLTDLLLREGIERFDFLNMDIELHEPKALAGFDIRRFTPALVCIEAHAEVRQAILDYFHANGYVLVGKYLRADTHNLWFTPRPA